MEFNRDYDTFRADVLGIICVFICQQESILSMCISQHINLFYTWGIEDHLFTFLLIYQQLIIKQYFRKAAKLTNHRSELPQPLLKNFERPQRKTDG